MHIRSTHKFEIKQNELDVWKTQYLPKKKKGLDPVDDGGRQFHVLYRVRSGWAPVILINWVNFSAR